MNQNKPFAYIIQELVDRPDPDPELDLFQSPSRQKLLQTFFEDQCFNLDIGNGDLYRDMYGQKLLNATERLLETAIYLGMDAAFCAMIIIELMYFIKFKKSELYLYVYLMNVDKAKCGYIWKPQPNFPVLHQCLQKDSLLKAQPVLTNKQKGQFFVEETLGHAVEAGNLRFVHLLNPNPFSVVELAAYFGHLHILKWAREGGAPWHPWVCAFAARNGHLEVLQ